MAKVERTKRTKRRTLYEICDNLTYHKSTERHTEYDKTS